MPDVTFIEPDGTVRTVTALPGESLMQAATRAAVAGIIGECGGSAMCATCHCYHEAGTLPPPEPLEAETVEFTARNVTGASRLACQIRADQATEGLVLRVAPQ
jgi:ferredoxin, 2Fe-2S